MKTLEQLGVTTKRAFITESSSSNLGGLELSTSTKERTKLTLTLPQPAPINATFQTEGLGQKISKIWKSELQSGDPAFDDAVYITTETPEATAHMLQSSAVRTLLRGLLEEGPVSISGNIVTLTVAGHIEGEDESAVRLINMLLR